MNHINLLYTLLFLFDVVVIAARCISAAPLINNLSHSRVLGIASAKVTESGLNVSHVIVK